MENTKLEDLMIEVSKLQLYVKQTYPDDVDLYKKSLLISLMIAQLSFANSKRMIDLVKRVTKEIGESHE